MFSEIVSEIFENFLWISTLSGTKNWWISENIWKSLFRTFFFTYLHKFSHLQPKSIRYCINKCMNRWYCYIYADTFLLKQHHQLFSRIHLHLKQKRITVLNSSLKFFFKKHIATVKKCICYIGDKTGYQL